MAVDDHVIDSLRRYFNDAYEELKKEWKTNEYGRLSDCPSFRLAYTYREAMDILIIGPTYFEDNKTERLKKMIDEDLELENYRKQKGC
jgi:hypothetical protein